MRAVAIFGWVVVAAATWPKRDGPWPQVVLLVALTALIGFLEWLDWRSRTSGGGRS